MCSSRFRGNAENDCFLLPQRNLYVKAWLYIARRDQHLSTQIYRYRIVSLHLGRQRPIGELGEDVSGGPYIVFTRISNVDENS